jgi:hypothetical protein
MITKSPGEGSVGFTNWIVCALTDCINTTQLNIASAVSSRCILFMESSFPFDGIRRAGRRSAMCATPACRMPSNSFVRPCVGKRSKPVDELQR